MHDCKHAMYNNEHSLSEIDWNVIINSIKNLTFYDD